MRDTETSTTGPAGGEAGSVRPHPAHRPADATDDLTRGEESGPTDPGAREPDLVDDAAGLSLNPADTVDAADPGDAIPGDGTVGDQAEHGDVNAADPGDAVPGDGTVDDRPEHGDVDALRTAAHGREAAAARADTSDTTPTPRETRSG